MAGGFLWAYVVNHFFKNKNKNNFFFFLPFDVAVVVENCLGHGGNDVLAVGTVDKKEEKSFPSLRLFFSLGA